ncbi:MAG: hypothetical protein ACRDVL_09445 [Acidimicrobiia bacterium]
MTRPTSRTISATAIAVVIGALAMTASATSLGGIDVADLFAWSAAVTVPIPDDIAADDFTCSGNLHGQPDDLGNVWADHGGDWQCLGSGEVRARQRLTLGHATVDLGVSDQVKVSAVLTSISTQPNRSGPGVSFLSDGISHMYAIYQRDQGRLILGKREIAIDTAMAAVTIADRATSEIRVEVDQPEIRVLVDGVNVISHTMTATEMILFGSNTRFGLEADNDNQSRFDWFRAESS